MISESNKRSWVEFWLVFVSGVSFGFSFFKVAPALPSLITYFDCSTADAGLFISIASLSAMLSALLMAPIQRRIGPKNMVLTSLVVAIIANIMGLLATDITWFFMSQFIAGIGFGFIQTGAPTLVNAIFINPSKRGLANSIWAAWTAVGLLVCLNGFTLIMAVFGTWQSAWVVALIICIVAAAICQFGISIDRESLMHVAQGDANDATAVSGKRTSSLTAYMVILAVLFALFGYVNESWCSMAPTYMQFACGLDMGMANFAVSLTTMVGIGSTVVIGIVMSRVRNQPLVMLVCFTLCAVAGCCEFIFTDSALMIPLAIFMGLCLNICPPTLFTNMQWAVDRPQAMGVGFAALAFGAGLGGTLASASIGMIVDATGNWAMATIPLVIAGIIMTALALLFAVKRGPLAKTGVPAGESPKVDSAR